MLATAATAKFSVAYLFPANSAATRASSHGGSFFDWTTLSMHDLDRPRLQDVRDRLAAATATSASVSDFQCGRRSVLIRIMG